MAVKIRLSRIGKIHAPVYRIIAIDSRKKRDGKALEILGTYNPIKGDLLQFKQERVDYWLSQGAQLSDAVRKLQKNVKKADASAKAA